ncbi:ABC transporter substrate-binding protein [Amphibacillus cookii]|uniref:ABC transporter substrate-binding protein n=1 Tax=Amphibacillus cookii TaxID=767787 RepID=UPI001EF7D472|nr:ABC transporter substrate-binding protein [Amphibacillus cookii]MBM7541967.1 iron complex transport system substrate-binding protein [Amphibacillus cookii]
MNKRLIKLSFNFFILMLFVLVGCANDQKETANQNDQEEATRILTDAVGNQVEVPEQPERVIASYLEDHLVALGITPVAQWSVADGTSVQDYLQEYLEGVDTIPHDLPLEAVSSFNPDLIIMESQASVDNGTYEQYDRIAPTYIVGEQTNDDWRESLRRIAEVFDLESEAEDVLNDYSEKATEAADKINQAIGDQSVAAIWLVGGQFYIVGKNVSSGAVLYEDLAITTPRVVEEISSTATANWSDISLEALADLDADHLFLINSDNEESTELFDDPLWKNIPAVQNNNVYQYGADTAWLYAGAIANEQIIDAILSSIIE